jgi:hypothetical protein
MAAVRKKGSEAMKRFPRILLLAALATFVYSGNLFAAVGGPELDPASATTGITVLSIGAIYLIERYRRRR